MHRNTLRHNNTGRWGTSPLSAALAALLFPLFVALCCPVGVRAAGFADAAASGNAVPVPPAERGLATERATELRVVTPERHTLEGAIFDRNGDLLFCDPTAGRVYRLLPDKTIALVAETPGFGPSGLALHADGRLFMTALNLEKKLGKIVALSADGKRLETIVPVKAGYLPNDLVFDRDGGFYFSDFRGSSTQPDGGVYYVAPGAASIVPVIPAMAQANGVALSPDGKILWATEYANNRLHRVVLDGAAKSTPTGYKVPYHFIGPAPDSMRVDVDGNVYVALVGQGRVLVFNQNGLPIGQVLLPEREQGRNLRSTCLALHPDAREMRIVSGNTAEADRTEARIFSAPAFAPGLPVPGGR